MISFGVEIEGPRNGHALLFATRQTLHLGIDADDFRSEAHVVPQEAARLLLLAFDVEEAPEARLLAADKDIAPQFLLVGERALLIDGFDPHLAGFPDRGQGDRLALEQNLA